VNRPLAAAPPPIRLCDIGTTVRKLFFWKLKRRELQLGDRTLLMAVLNVTPDSFSDGGKYLEPDRAFARAMELEEQGADIVDIGAESTRPGSARVTAAVELQRLIPVLKRLRDRLGIPISVDTYKAEVAERALELGAEIVNDPSGLTWEPHLVVDPGLGFGKRREQNAFILARLGELAALDLPILTGPSRKHFLAHQSAEETRFATAAAVTVSILGGAHIVRVHDAREMRAAADVADEILRARRENGV